MTHHVLIINQVGRERNEKKVNLLAQPKYVILIALERIKLLFGLR